MRVSPAKVGSDRIDHEVEANEHPKLIDIRQATWHASGPKVLWKTKVGGGFSGPAIAAGKLYTMGFARAEGIKSPGMGKEPGHDHVWCLDAATGEVVWKHTYRCTRGSYWGPFCTPARQAAKESVRCED